MIQGFVKLASFDAIVRGAAHLTRASRKHAVTTRGCFKFPTAFWQRFSV